MGKAALIFGLCLTGIQFASATQQKGKPNSLFKHAPADWRKEVIPFPLEFAPTIALEGVEELRFAPGMFDPASDTYFTYAFLWFVKGKPHFDAAQLEKDLLAYFKGLYNAVSKVENKNTSGFQATVTSASTANSFEAVVRWVDPFTTEKDLTLNLRISKWYCQSSDKTTVFFTVSPQQYQSKVWKKLGKIKATGCQ